MYIRIAVSFFFKMDTAYFFEVRCINIMLKEEMEIKNIATNLSSLKSYIKMNTKLNLNDICIVSEDFFCGL